MEPGIPSPAHLTVLALDAIALATGEATVTFQHSPLAGAPESMDSAVAGNANESINSEASAGAEPDIAILMARLSTREARQAAIQRYREEVYGKTGKQITKTNIWKDEGGYKTRSDFERWERCDPDATMAAHRTFCRILVEKPHLK